MEEKHAAAATESAHAESNGVSHGSDHGWQKATERFEAIYPTLKEVALERGRKFPPRKRHADEENHITAMEVKHAAAATESAHAESNSVSHGADHGWQKVSYGKKQRKKTVNGAADSRANSNKLQHSMMSSQLVKSPRGSKRRRQRLKSWPVRFSPFARALARVTSLSTPKRRSPNPLSTNKSQPEQSDSSDNDDDFIDNVVQADFSFFDPKPNDFHGAKTLLQTYLGNQEWDLSSFVDLILAQTTVGTVVKIEGDEDEGLFALVTALNLYRYREHTCIVTIKDFLLHKACQEKGVADQLRLLWGEQAPDVGLLVSQRMVNLPPQLLPPLYDALFDEVSWATEDEPTEELRNSFKFKYYIMLTKIYMLKNVEQKRKRSNDSDEAIIYVKLEDEIFHKLSSWSFCFPLETQQLAHELRNYRSTGLIMVVEADKIPTFRQELASLINET